MTKHLSSISNKTMLDKHAVVIMNGVGWHTEDIAVAFGNQDNIVDGASSAIMQQDSKSTCHHVSTPSTSKYHGKVRITVIDGSHIPAH